MAEELTGSVEVRRIWQLLEKILSAGDLSVYRVMIDSKNDTQSYQVPLDVLLSFAGGGGSGDVSGPVGATNNAVVLFDTASGKLIKDSTVLLSSMEYVANKDASGGYVGKTGESINFWNAARTFMSFFVNAATAIRTYTFPNKDITVAGLDDVPSISGLLDETAHDALDHTGLTGIPSISGLEATANKDASNGYSGLTLFAHNFWNAAKTFLTTVIGTATAARAILLPNKDGTIALLDDCGATIIDQTYAQLAALKAGSTLVKGQLYRITDHITKHLISNTLEIRSADAIEPLIIQAIDVNKFALEVNSLLFPKDIIHYNFDDNSCENGVWNIDLQRYTGGTARTGKIVFRQDTVRQLETHYDWRNVKFRRWAVSAVAWVSGNAYSKYEVVLGVDGNIYVCKFNTSGIIDPNSDLINWQMCLELTTFNFWSWTYDASDFNPGNIDTGNLIINNITPNVDYIDVYTFCFQNDYNNSSGVVDAWGTPGYGYNQIRIGKVNYDYMQSNGCIYNNVVLCMYDGSLGDDIRNNNFYDNCANSTIAGYEVKNNLFKGNFYFNVIQDYFNANDIYVNCINNIILELENGSIKASFTGNIISINCKFNIFGGEFLNNILGDQFQNNFIKGEFEDSIIFEEFYYNTISDGFKENEFKSRCSNNRIGSGFKNNMFIDIVEYNTIGEIVTNINGTKAFRNNNIGNNMDFSAVNFAAATFILTTYEKRMFLNAAGVNRLSYINAANALTNVAVNA